MFDGIFGYLRRLLRRAGPSDPVDTPLPVRAPRGAVDHVILLDGTNAALIDGRDSSIGRICMLLRQGRPRSLYYRQGLQWRGWRDFSDAVLGWGVEREILAAYGWLASRYRPGDRIFLMGYSRGAFAVRSLAGLIDRVGLLRADAATERNLRLAWRHYEGTGGSAVAFRRVHCHEETPIEMLGVFDSVMALGLPLPLLAARSEPRRAFHEHRLAPAVRHGYHALALDETRRIFEPLIWETTGRRLGHVEQVWFRGTHGDIGGQLQGEESARPLANIPLVWMLERAEAAGLALPEDWRAAFPTDAEAPSVGTWKRWGKLMLLRASRPAGRDASERIHESVIGGRRGWAATVLPGLRTRMRLRRRPAAAQATLPAAMAVALPDAALPERVPVEN